MLSNIEFLCPTEAQICISLRLEDVADVVVEAYRVKQLDSQMGPTHLTVLMPKTQTNFDHRHSQLDPCS